MPQKAYKNQDYDKLKKDALGKGALFEDSEFPANDSSIYFSDANLAKDVVWKRPGEICNNPRLFSEGVDQGDVKQGQLGNCWFVAASSTLAQHKQLWDDVIPDYKEQEWPEDPEKVKEKYAGIFHFRFWRFGDFMDVVIDDLLPCRNGKLVFIHSDEQNEFWSGLLEKAYAKLAGCYEALDGGNLTDALEDFTGGIGETIPLDESYDEDAEQDALFDALEVENKRKNLMSAAINISDESEMEAVTNNGLVKGHAYGVTGLKTIKLDTGFFSGIKSKSAGGNDKNVDLIRLRNPWGSGEWKGRFSDSDPEWEKVPSSEREKLDLSKDEDGEFWMSMEDFCKFFDEISVCRLINTSVFAKFSGAGKVWEESEFIGTWKCPDRAGGCVNSKDTFLKNPQYLFSIKEEEDECLIHLSQRDARYRSVDNEEQHDYFGIGFYLMKVELNRKYRVHQFKYYEKIDNKVKYTKTRSIFSRCHLKRGRYCLIPTTFSPEQETKYILRLYTDNENDGVEAVKERPTPKTGIKKCFGFKNPACVTVVKIVKAEGLEHQDREGGADPYCYIEYAGEKCKTHTVPNSLSPEWNQSAIFYRKEISKPITVEVWNKESGFDKKMGFAEIEIKSEDNRSMSVALKSDKDEEGEKGKIKVEIESTLNITEL